MTTQREARRDAREYARAQMSYGEGAGTRRKLIVASVDAKAHRDPAYARAFHTELSRQDMAEHARRAQKERHRADVKEAVRRNTRAVVTGNRRNLQTSILLILAVYSVLHETGLDVKIYQKGRIYAYRIRAKIRKYRENREKLS